MSILSLSLAILLTACSQSSAPPAPPGIFKVQVAIPAAPEGDAFVKSINVYFQEKSRFFKVEKLGLDIYFDQIAAILLSGRSDYDLIYLPVESLPRWVSYHALQPLPFKPDDERLQAVAPFTGSLIFDGYLYGIPTQPAGEVLFYRADLFEQAGLAIPQSWDEFVNVAKILNHPPDQYGLALAGSPLDAGTEFAAYLSAYCGQQACEKHPERWSQALAFYSGLYQPGLSSPEAIDQTRAGAADALKEGRAAMAVLPLSYAPALMGEDSNLSAAPLPGLSGASAGGLGVWAIPRKAQNTEAAADLALWLASEPGARAWVNGGGIPANQQVLRDPQVQAGAEYLGFLKDIEAYRPLLPRTTDHENNLNALNTAVRSSLMGERTPEAAILSFFENME